MASYEYSGTYFGTYYLFVTDTDASNAAAEAVVKIGIHPVLGETGTGADTGSITKESFSSADAGTFAEAGSVPQSVSSADTFSGAEGVPATVRLADVDFTLALEVDTVSDTDTGSCTDFAVGLTPLSADSGSVTELQSLVLSDAAGELALFFDQAQAVPLGLLATDTFTGAETTGFLPAFPFSSADTGGVNPATGETGIALPDILAADSGTFAEVSSILARLPAADSGSFSDAGSPLVPVASADTGQGLESSFIAIATSADTGSVNPATGEVASINVMNADAGSASETMSLPDNPFGSDAGTFTDAQVLVAHVADADVIHWTELSWHAIPASLLYANPEGFSIYRAAILSNGSEVAQLYGVREGMMIPTVNTVNCSGDDTVVGIWNDIDNVRVTVTAGFMPYDAVALVLGWDEYSSVALGQYALSVGQMGMSPNVQFAMVLRCHARDYLDKPRTLDFMLYQVSFQQIDFTYAYKTGMEVTYDAVATSGYQDELGNPLVDREYGRLVESPGQMTGAILSVFGQGT